MELDPGRSKEVNNRYDYNTINNINSKSRTKKINAKPINKVKATRNSSRIVDTQSKTNTAIVNNGHIDISNREKVLIHPRVPPWDTANVNKIEFYPDMITLCDKRCSTEIKKEITEETLKKLGDFDYELWTDGSVEHKLGAGAGMLYKGRDCISTMGAPSGFLSSSYRSELVALDTSLSTI